MNKKVSLQPRRGQKEADHVLVYSTDPKIEKRCLKCSKSEINCDCNSLQSKAIGAIKPVIRIEKKGRGGKVVTLLQKLPQNEKFLKDLCKYLKAALGCGGTYYVEEFEGIIEIQGDRQKDLPVITQKYLNSKSRDL